jgi:hypothetical protein
MVDQWGPLVPGVVDAFEPWSQYDPTPPLFEVGSSGGPAQATFNIEQDTRYAGIVPHYESQWRSTELNDPTLDYSGYSSDTTATLPSSPEALGQIPVRQSPLEEVSDTPFAFQVGLS